MNSVGYVIVLLSEHAETYRTVEGLLCSDDGNGGDSEFTVLWVDITRSHSWDELPLCDGILSDASCQYLLEHQEVIRAHCCFWLVESAVEQIEFLHLGATDCFLWGELNGSLLRHCLRLANRQRSSVHDPLHEFQGDRFQTLIQNIPGAVYRCLHSAIWHGMYISDAIESIVGYPAADFSPGGDRTFASVIYGEDLVFVDQVIDGQLQNRDPYVLEYRLVHRDGSMRWVEERGQGVFDEAGKLLWIDGVIFDITERREFLERLEKQQKNYYEKTPAMLHSINRQGEIVAVSDRWLEVMGYKREEVLGRPAIDFLTPQSRQYALTQVLPLFQQRGHIEDVEYQVVKEDGQVIDVLLSAIRDDSSSEWRSLTILTDVTARNQLTAQLSAYQNRLQNLVRQRTQALASSEARLRTLFNVLPLGIVEVDLEGCFLRVNDQFAQMVGRSELELIGCPVQDVTYSDDRQTTQNILGSLQRGEISEFVVDKRYLRGPDDEHNYFWGHLRVMVVKNGQGKTDYLIGVVEDIHERKVMEGAIGRSGARLQRSQAIAKIGAWEWDIQQNQTYWSKESYEIFGYEPFSFTPNAESFLNALHPDDRPRVEAEIEATLREGKSGKIISEYRIIRPDGQVRVIQDYHELVCDGQGQMIALGGATMDVTENRQMIAALQASETRLAKSQAIAKIGSWEWDLVQDKLIWSDELFRIFDLEPRSIEPTYEIFLQFVEPGDRPRCDAVIDSLRQGQNVENFEHTIITTQGSQKNLLTFAEAQRNDQGNVVLLLGATQDITHLKQTISALQISEARFRGIFDQAALGIAQINLAGQFILTNQAFCDLVGYTQTELKHMTWQQITHPDDVDVCAGDVARMLQGAIRSTVIEKRYLHKQGHTVWIKAIASFIHDPEGQPQYLLGLVEDITDYKLTKANFTQTQHRYQALVEGVHGIIYQYSTKRGGIFYSSRLKDILGYGVEYMLAHSFLWYESIHPEDRDRVDQAIANLQHQESKQFMIEYRIRDAMGDWHWFSDKSFRIEQQENDANEDDTPEYIVSGLALDITERHRIDAILDHRLNLETVLAEISHRMIVQSDLDLVEILELLGKTFQADRMSVMLAHPEQFTTLECLATWSATVDLAMDDQVLVCLDGDTYPWWFSRWQNQQPILVNRDRPLPQTATLEREFLAALGIEAMMWIPIPDHHGDHWGYIECSTTNPEHQSWSREDVDLLAIAGTLIYNFRMRKQATQQLELAKEAAEAANHAKSQFLMNMSHELRTPLNAILGFAQIMAQSPTFPQEHRDRLDILQASGRKLLNLLNDILDLASFDWGRADLNPVLFNLYGLLDDLKHMFQHLIRQKSLDLAIEHDDNLPRFIIADQAKLHSVLIHLLGNAIKFTNEGQVRLKIEVKNPDPLTLRFSVTDTGVGIAQTDQHKLFKDFVKLEAGDLLGQGSGLGLALSQKFVILMGSEIQVSSRPNIGSCFSFELPCVANDQLLERRSPLALSSTRPEAILTQESFRTLPATWRQQFHQAACAARATTLEQLIQQLPPEATTIAKTLTNMVQKLDFTHLVALSELPASESVPHP